MAEVSVKRGQHQPIQVKFSNINPQHPTAATYVWAGFNNGHWSEDWGPLNWASIEMSEEVASQLLRGLIEAGVPYHDSRDPTPLE